MTHFIFYFSSRPIRSIYNFSFLLERGGRGYVTGIEITFGLRSVRKFRTKSIVKITQYPKEPDRTIVPTEKILINALVAGEPLCTASIAVIVITRLRKISLSEKILFQAVTWYLSRALRERGRAMNQLGTSLINLFWNKSSTELRGALRTLFGESQ